MSENNGKLSWRDHDSLKLNAAEMRFVDAFMGVAQGSATTALKLAGGPMSRKRADEVLLRPRVQSEIHKRALQMRNVELGAMTPMEIHHLLRRCAYDADVKWGLRLKAIELTMRCQGMMIDRVAHHHKHEKVQQPVVIDFSKMSNKQLRELVYRRENRELEHEDIIDVGEQ